MVHLDILSSPECKFKLYELKATFRVQTPGRVHCLYTVESNNGFFLLALGICDMCDLVRSSWIIKREYLKIDPCHII